VAVWFAHSQLALAAPAVSPPRAPALTSAGMALTFTTQQLTGGARYSNGVKIGARAPGSARARRARP